MELPVRTELRLPEWVEALGEEDLAFLKRMLLSSGSLKAMAEEYGVSYPTIRARLDRLIAKVKECDQPASSDPFEAKLRRLVSDGKLPATLARELLEIHRSAMGESKR
jgi:hypothetical protein